VFIYICMVKLNIVKAFMFLKFGRKVPATIWLRPN
jgi:hypothetical protein